MRARVGARETTGDSDHCRDQTRILAAADPDAFASLVLLNSKWRSASQQGHLYATQLMRCPSYSASHKKEPDGKQQNLPALKNMFAREVKRNLFHAYLRPNHTMIKIVSNSISSSSCPGGDGIIFSPSPKGHYLLAYNSSRIHIIDLRRPTISVERELKILRRPVATCIQDDGSLLAVLLTEMQVELYDLTHTPPKHTQSLILDHSPRAIALSPCGSVLAAAYEGGIEVQSLNPGALATERRSVKCDGVDALAFSFDGTQILGTTVQSAQPNTVILTAPYYDPGAQMDHENISALWTTSILFPNTSRDCSHAVLLQESSHEEASWTFTYDRSFETFRAVRIDDLRNGTSYFTGPTSNTPSKLLPCTLPSASYNGELVSAGFQDKEVWLYGVPEDLEAIPDTSNSLLEVNPNSEGVFRSSSGSSMRSRPRTQEAGERRVPQWQLLCDRYRNTFVGGFKAAELKGVSTVKWVASYGDSSLKERLVIAAKGATPAKPISMDDDGMDFEDGGRLTLIDFDYGLEDGQVNEVTIEVGMKDPEVLEEEHRDLETEVAIVRRRTVAQRRGNRSAIMRAATTAARPTSAHVTDDNDDDDDPLRPRHIGLAPVRIPPAPIAAEETDTQAVLEEAEALDAPYSHTGPRSIATIRRAATAAANHRRRNPTIATGAPIEYRRADGRAEHPHESDADNWVPPPPPYQKEDPGEAPAFLRHSMVPALDTARPHPSNKQIPLVPRIPPVPPIPQAHRPGSSTGSTSPHSQAPASRRQTYMPDRQQSTDIRSTAHHRLSSYPTMPSSLQGPAEPPAGTLHYEEEDIYNVSPPDTPRPPESAPAGSQSSETSEYAQAAVHHGPAPSALISNLNAATYTGTQRVIPLVPRIQTTAASSPGIGQQPVPAQAVPEPSSAGSTWNPHTGLLHTGGGSHVAPVMHSQTWPIPPPGSVAHARATMGYPRTAPPTSISTDDMIAHSQSYGHPYPLPPPPIPKQEDESSNVRTSSRQSLSRRLSTGFHLPHRRTAANRSQSRTNERTRPLSIALQPPRPETSNEWYRQQEPPRPGTAHATSRTQPQQNYTQSTPAGSDLSYGDHAADRARPQPDQPLIISTPTGVQGSYDDPSGRPSEGQRAQAPILAPVPRHPHPGQSPGILRPAERLENIYSGLLNPTAATATALPVESGDNLSSSRISSINRRPSRAERSAARNMADAKRQGWRPGRSKSKKAKKEGRLGRGQHGESDLRSQGGWTDITLPTTVGTGPRGRRAVYNGLPVGGQQQQQQKVEKDKKCVVM